MLPHLARVNPLPRAAAWGTWRSLTRTGRTFPLRGGLERLQAMAVAGSMTDALEEADGGTGVTSTYVVGGDAAVDSVIQDQLAGLAEPVESE